MSELTLRPERAALLIVDIQERLVAAMPDKVAQQVERNVTILCELARRFHMPVVVSEQYPKGLGPTRAPIEEALASLGPLVHRLEKIEFSVCNAADFGAVRADVSRDQWIVTGMECHVCVYQTVRQLVATGASVHVPEDAVCSRTKANWNVGLDLMRRAGAVVTATEVLVFDALGKAGGDDFKALSRLIR